MEEPKEWDDIFKLADRLFSKTKQRTRLKILEDFACEGPARIRTL